MKVKLLPIAKVCQFLGLGSCGFSFDPDSFIKSTNCCQYLYCKALVSDSILSLIFLVAYETDLPQLFGIEITLNLGAYGEFPI